MTSGKCSLLKLTRWQHGAVPSSICTSNLYMYKLAKNFNTLRRINSASSLGNDELTVNHVGGFAILTLTRGCHCLLLHNSFWMKFCLSATNKWLLGWKKNPKLPKSRESQTELRAQWRVEERPSSWSYGELGCCPWTQATHDLLKSVSHVSNSHGLNIFVGENAIKPFCALVIQVFNKRKMTL